MRNTIVYILGSSLFLFCTLFLAVNIVASQLVFPNLMFRLLDERTVSAAREFIKNLEGNELLVTQQRYYNSVFGNMFEKEASTDALNKERALEQYRKLLLVSPRNPQLLTKIGLIEAGIPNPAALEIDPWVLEKNRDR